MNKTLKMQGPLEPKFMFVWPWQWKTALTALLMGTFTMFHALLSKSDEELGANLVMTLLSLAIAVVMCWIGVFAIRETRIKNE